MEQLEEFKFSSHAKKRLKERRIGPEHVVLTVESPQSKMPKYKGTHGGIVYHFTRQFGGKKLAVIAELYKKTCYVVTAYYP